MEEHYEQMIAEAREKFGDIFPCGEKAELMDCFTYEQRIQTLMFWFNVAQGKTTRMITRKITTKDTQRYQF